MSGTLAVTVRMPDGAEHRQLWPTSALTRLLHPGLFDKDPGYLSTLVHGPWDGWEHEPGTLAPSGYGLIVVDLQEDVLIENQGAQDLSTISLFHLTLAWTPEDTSAASTPASFLDGLDPRTPSQDHVALTRDGASPTWYANRGSDAAHFAALYEAGRVPLLRDPEGAPYAVPSGRLRQALELARRLTRIAPDLYRQVRFVIDTRPLRIESFLHTPDRVGAYQAQLARVRDLGFQLSPEEEASWLDWTTPCRDQQAEGTQTHTGRDDPNGRPRDHPHYDAQS